MKVNKQVTINLGQYESLKIGVEEAPNYDIANNAIITELKRIDIPVSKKIFQCLQWENNKNDKQKD